VPNDSLQIDNKKMPGAAAGQYRGYALQAVRVCAHLLECEDGERIWLEHLDDVGTERSSKERLLEHAASHNPVADWAEDLWKSLAHWVALCVSGRVDAATSRFRLYVVQKHTGEVVRQLHDARTSEDVRDAGGLRAAHHQMGTRRIEQSASAIGALRQVRSQRRGIAGPIVGGDGRGLGDVPVALKATPNSSVPRNAHMPTLMPERNSRIPMVLTPFTSLRAVLLRFLKMIIAPLVFARNPRRQTNRSASSVPVLGSSDFPCFLMNSTPKPRQISAIDHSAAS
jgi:hypothetical protein